MGGHCITCNSCMNKKSKNKVVQEPGAMLTTEGPNDIDDRDMIKQHLAKLENQKLNDVCPTNRTNGENDEITLNKQIFVFNHLKDEMDIRKDYTISDILGSGAYGEVRKCINKMTGLERAVKIIRKEKMSENEQK
jgi:hypothetical protein